MTFKLENEPVPDSLGYGNAAVLKESARDISQNPQNTPNINTNKNKSC
jgi:hypothetical protein